MKIIAAIVDRNEKGDLFTDRMTDLIYALGYETEYVNIHKPGREIDIYAKHRIENRRIIAECKSQSKPVSGADLNKFAGALQAEKEHDPLLSGYFISLSGFTAPASHQENEFEVRRFEMLGPDAIAKQLIEGNVIASQATAFFVAATMPGIPANVKVGAEATLLLHRIGWIWIVPVVRAGQKIGNILVHASGELLAASLVEQVVDDLRAFGAPLEILCPSEVIAPTESDAEVRYLEYVVKEYGSITLEGLAVDQYTGASVLKLEEIYVPLYLEVPRPEAASENAIATARDPEEEVSENVRLNLVKALPDSAKIAVLASPGAGKSTMVRRIAVAFADPARRSEVADSLPSRSWLPLVIRARDIRSVTASSILNILYDLPRRAEMSSAFGDSFRKLVDRKLQTGNVILLVDGLDEIAAESDRRIFASQLRTFVAMYPSTQLVVTSREAGFRIVSSEISTYCKVYNLSELTDDDICQLIYLWYSKAISSSNMATNQVQIVAQKILDNYRVRLLAANPLLLTTLLYVQRWAGEIPKRRALLYDRAIDLLLMTWNVEGHAPLPLEEVLPQLAYLAFDMINRGIQRITSSEAEKIFAEARQSMPEVLGYATESPREIINRIESRSSLLVLAGYGIEDNLVQPYYEFRHLAFQEYLAALAIAREWAPNSLASTPLEILRPSFVKSRWSEVIVLCSVLLGRKGGTLVEALVATLEERFADYDVGDESDFQDIMLLNDMIYSCLSDEAQLKPEQASTALNAVVVYGNIHSCEALLAGRYGALLAAMIMATLEDPSTDPTIGMEYFWLAADVVMQDISINSAQETESSVWGLLNSDRVVDHLFAMSFITRSAYEKLGGGDVPGYRENFVTCAEVIPQFQDRVIALLKEVPSNLFIWSCGCWMLTWAYAVFDFSKDLQLEIASNVLSVLFQDESSSASSTAGLFVYLCFVETWRELAERLTLEQERMLKDRLRSTDKYREHSSLGMAVIAAADPRRFGRSVIVEFAMAHLPDGSRRWQAVIDLANGKKLTKRDIN
ncbi:MAG TPA: restriction endonuclease [Streptosporangiaceae bacterium]|nr:restriction endonuclease [Streptosporangiaceae bacterium]